MIVHFAQIWIMGCCCSCLTSHPEEVKDGKIINPPPQCPRHGQSRISSQPQVFRRASSSIRSNNRTSRSKRIIKREKGTELKKLYSWGENSNEELGHEIFANSNGIVAKPTQIGSASLDVRSIACGESHTLFVMANGTLWSCGSNDHGQLGHSKKGRGGLAPVDHLGEYDIIAAAAGYAHSLAICRSGDVLSWGSNAHGQLGLNLKKEKVITTPKPIQALSGKTAIQIAAGHSHSMILTHTGELYTCGSNKSGQLGFTSSNIDEIVPHIVVRLIGFPIAAIATGDFHSFALGVGGGVFGWGKNSCGQLGVGDTEDKIHPTYLKTLTSQVIRWVSAGSDHSVFLTQDGGVFSVGDGRFGQLGHEYFGAEIFPRKILEFGGTPIVQIACGRGTTLCTTATGKVYCFGQSEWSKVQNDSNSHTLIDTFGMPVHSIYAGNGQYFAMISDTANNKITVDYRAQYSKILTFNASNISQICSTANTDCETILPIVETLFSSASVYNASFSRPQDTATDDFVNAIDVDEAETVLSKLESIKSRKVLELIESLVLGAIANIPIFISIHDTESAHLFVLVTLFPSFYEGESFDLPIGLAREVLNLPLKIRQTVFNWYYNLRIDLLQRLVSVYKRAVMKTVDENHNDRPTKLSICLTFLRSLNVLNRKHQRLSYHAFTLPQLSCKVKLEHDYLSWLLDKAQVQKQAGRSDVRRAHFFFCNYPFVFDSHAKSILLEVDQFLQMRRAIRNAAANEDVLDSIRQGTAEMGTIETIFVNIAVSRDTIVEDALDRIMTLSPEELKRPLKVKFINEEAEDAGGVRKEFFLLLIKEILDEKCGMFHRCEESFLLWFSEKSQEDNKMFFLLGIIMGLAIYNNIIVNFPFPLGLFKKLLGEKVGLEDLREMEPSLTANLEKLLEYEGPELDDVFCLTFEYNYRNCFGAVSSIPLKPGGADIPVTQKNKKEYVDVLVDYKLNHSTRLQFAAFKDGFDRVCQSPLLSFFYPEQLQEMIVGNDDYEWGELEEYCTYGGSYWKKDPTILLFWEVFHELSLEDKKQYLLFLTGSDRIPISGMKTLKMIIEKGASEEHLPVAHTCFNQLDLPPYRTKEVLRSKLSQAIENNSGFSLV